jgi:hypothetical protein
MKDNVDDKVIRVLQGSQKLESTTPLSGGKIYAHVSLFGFGAPT